MALPSILPMKRYQFKLCAENWVNKHIMSETREPTFSRVRMRIRVQLIFFIRQPQSTIRIKDLFTQRRQKLFEYTSTINTSSK